MSEAFQDAKDAIIDGVFKFIDRMNDLCDTDNAERVVSESTTWILLSKSTLS